MLHVVNMNQNLLGKKVSDTFIQDVLKKENEEKVFINLNVKDVSETEGEVLNSVYFLVNENEIIGCCSLMLHSDATHGNFSPWITSLYISEEYRGHSYGQLLINHVIHKAEVLGYDSAYLTTDDVVDYYPQNWTKIEHSHASIDSRKIYYKRLDERSYYSN